MRRGRVRKGRKEGGDRHLGLGPGGAKWKHSKTGNIRRTD